MMPSLEVVSQFTVFGLLRAFLPQPHTVDFLQSCCLCCPRNLQGFALFTSSYPVVRTWAKAVPPWPLPPPVSGQVWDRMAMARLSSRGPLDGYLVVMEYGVCIHILPRGHIEPQFPHEEHLVGKCHGGPWKRGGSGYQGYPSRLQSLTPEENTPHTTSLPLLSDLKSPCPSPSGPQLIFIKQCRSCLQKCPYTHLPAVRGTLGYLSHPAGS